MCARAARRRAPCMDFALPYPLPRLALPCPLPRLALSPASPRPALPPASPRPVPCFASPRPALPPASPRPPCLVSPCPVPCLLPLGPLPTCSELELCSPIEMWRRLVMPYLSTRRSMICFSLRMRRFAAILLRKRKTVVAGGQSTIVRFSRSKACRRYTLASALFVAV